jgi:ribose/xylose/arabinose/galactoside ABC-type transport system permease subunit
VSFAGTLVRRNRLLPSYIVVTSLLVALIVTGGIVSDRFLSWRNVSNLFQQMSVLGLASLGQTFVILLGGIDLSVGSLVSAATVFLASFLNWQPDLLWFAIPLALVVTSAIGALNGYLSVRLGVHPLIVTLGMSSTIFGACLSYRKEPGGSIPPGFDSLAFGSLWGAPLPAIALIGAFLVAGIWLQRSRSGRSLYFVGGGFENARLNGLPVTRITTGVYALSGFCAGLAAIFLVAKTGVGDPRIGAA